MPRSSPHARAPSCVCRRSGPGCLHFLGAALAEAPADAAPEPEAAGAADSVAVAAAVSVAVAVAVGAADAVAEGFAEAGAEPDAFALPAAGAGSSQPARQAAATVRTNAIERVPIVVSFFRAQPCALSETRFCFGSSRSGVKRCQSSSRTSLCCDNCHQLSETCQWSVTTDRAATSSGSSPRRQAPASSTAAARCAGSRPRS